MFRPYFDENYFNQGPKSGGRSYFRSADAAKNSVANEEGPGAVKPEDKSGKDKAPQETTTSLPKEPPGAESVLDGVPASGRDIKQTGGKKADPNSTSGAPQAPPPPPNSGKQTTPPGAPGAGTLQPAGEPLWQTQQAWLKHYQSLYEMYSTPVAYGGMPNARLAQLAKEMMERVALAPPDKVLEVVKQGMESPAALQQYNQGVIERQQGWSAPREEFNPILGHNVTVQDRDPNPSWGRQPGERVGDYQEWLATGGAEQTGAPAEVKSAAQEAYYGRTNGMLGGAPKPVKGDRRPNAEDQKAINDNDKYRRARGL